YLADGVCEHLKLAAIVENHCLGYTTVLAVICLIGFLNTLVHARRRTDTVNKVVMTLHGFGYNLLELDQSIATEANPNCFVPGLAFQLVDDVLDFTGTSSSLRKGSVSDIRHACVSRRKVLEFGLHVMILMVIEICVRAAEGAPESLGDSAHIHGPSSNSRTRERTSPENQISSQVHSRFSETTADTNVGTNTAAPQRLNIGPEVIPSGPSAKFAIRLLLAYSVGKRMLRLKMGECPGLDETANWINFFKDYFQKKKSNGFIDSPGIDIPLCHISGPCRMMADIIAENSLASAQSCQNVNKSTIDAPANALLRKYTVTRDTVLRKRRRAGNASTCRDVCNLGVASDIINIYALFSNPVSMPLTLSFNRNISSNGTTASVFRSRSGDED
ncbi:solanesyl diphosphate synthase 3, chloroplastic/mitochondrial-like protein isoform X2, partial [Tanacetum coccineum]